MKHLLRIYRWFVFVLFKKETDFVISESEPYVEEKPKRKKSEENLNPGIWYRFGDLLEVLDKYYEHIKIFKTYDPDAYKMYSKIGGTITAEKSLYFSNEPLSLDINNIPSFGCVHFKMEEHEDENGEISFTPVLAYFQKYKKLWMVQPSKDEIFEVTICYYDKRKKKSFNDSFHLAMSKDKNCTLLKQMALETKTIKSKTPSAKRESRSSQITQKVYKHAAILSLLRQENLNKGIDRTIEQTATGIFFGLLEHHQNANTGLQVRCEKNNVHAIFHIDMLRTPYFFKDRNKVVNENGNTKRIFHIVRVHERNYKEGGKTYIKTHFRGLRKFHWKGFNVNITMQGYHHKDILTFDTAALGDKEETQMPKGYMGMEKVIELINERMSA